MHTPLFVYTFACHEDELPLCALEKRTVFGADASAGSHLLCSPVAFEPSRSPFVKERIDVLYQGDSVSAIARQLPGLQLSGSTFKVIFVKKNDLEPPHNIEYAGQRAIERELGASIAGTADVHKPDHTFGVVTVGGRWYFGRYRKAEPVWLHHMKKPHSYSIALPTRIARAIVNIAVPDPQAAIRAIDPCCGIGTVLVEALSMGIAITGRDINPLAVRGARANIASFGLTGEVALGSIADIEASYDAAIVDMPYNRVTRISPEEQLSILHHTRRIANKAVIVTTGDIDEQVTGAGFAIRDRCAVRKGAFSRHILICT
ncbi:MAG: methyltransferase [Paenibacillus sp.]|nr:methyltransferase [Paenibacillus sp.]